LWFMIPMKGTLLNSWHSVIYFLETWSYTIHSLRFVPQISYYMHLLEFVCEPLPSMFQCHTHKFQWHTHKIV
ncbi:hypothetical protein BAE44_0022572, partial [Dichanthelium oligosanthes]